MKLRVAGIIPDSIVDGPGIRLSLFMQGCSHCCPGCHNRELQDTAGGVEMTVAEVFAKIKAARGIDGVTFSGGEPFEQAAPLAVLAEKIRNLGLTLVLYSGFTFTGLLELAGQDRSARRLLEAGTLLIDGPYIARERDLTLAFRGSRNQRILDLPRSLQQGFPVLWEPSAIISGVQWKMML